MNYKIHGISILVIIMTGLFVLLGYVETQIISSVDCSLSTNETTFKDCLTFISHENISLTTNKGLAIVFGIMAIISFYVFRNKEVKKE